MPGAFARDGRGGHRTAWAVLAVVVAIAVLAIWQGVPYPSLEKEWAIGVYSGSSLLSLHPLQGIRQPVLTASDVTDVGAAYVADPFLVRDESGWLMFFEVLERASGRGSIGMASSGDGRSWTYARTVLREPFHLSYPYVFRDGADVFMVPECQATQSIRLYRADPFPRRWVLAGTLIDGLPFADPSVLKFAGRWWLFASVGHYRDGTLRLYWSDQLTGPWHEHPRSPIVTANAHNARPGGRILVVDGRVIRMTQDDDPAYGWALRAFEVTELTPDSYRERPLADRPLLRAEAGWNAAGMHHLDAHGSENGEWFAAVDGHRRRWNWRWWRSH